MRGRLMVLGGGYWACDDCWPESDEVAETGVGKGGGEADVLER